jgi:hypothetical protein
MGWYGEDKENTSSYPRRPATMRLSQGEVEEVGGGGIAVVSVANARRGTGMEGKGVQVRIGRESQGHQSHHFKEI